MRRNVCRCRRVFDLVCYGDIPAVEYNSRFGFIAQHPFEQAGIGPQVGPEDLCTVAPGSLVKRFKPANGIIIILTGFHPISVGCRIVEVNLFSACHG